MNIKILSAAFAFLSASTAFAAAASLKCTLREGGLTASIRTLADGRLQVDQSEKESNWQTGKTTWVRTRYALSPTGRVNFAKHRDFADQKWVASFYLPSRPGSSFASIGLTPRADGQVPIELRYTRKSEFGDIQGDASGTCVAGTGFAAFARRADRLPEIPLYVHLDRMDSQVGLACEAATGPFAGELFQVRTIKGSFGSATVQVHRRSEEAIFGRVMLDRVTRAGNRVTFTARPETIVYPPVPGEATFSFAPVKGKKGRYAAELFDGSDVSTLACEERWALGNVFQALEEQARIAVALPAVPGTAAQIDAKKARDYEAARAVQDRYSDLIMQIPGVSTLGVQAKDMNLPRAKWTYVLMIGVAEVKDLPGVKGRLGESLDGIEIQYEETGVFTF